MSRFLLFQSVCVGWIFFRAADLVQALALMQQLFTASWHWDLAPGMLICVLMGIGMHYLPSRVLLRAQLACIRMPAMALGALFAISLTLIEVLGPSAPAPFIYFQF